jgi:hypothetical protein
MEAYRSAVCNSQDREATQLSALGRLTVALADKGPGLSNAKGADSMHAVRAKLQRTVLREKIQSSKAAHCVVYLYHILEKTAGETELGFLPEGVGGGI